MFKEISAIEKAILKDSKIESAKALQEIKVVTVRSINNIEKCLKRVDVFEDNIPYNKIKNCEIRKRLKDLVDELNNLSDEIENRV